MTPCTPCPIPVPRPSHPPIPAKEWRKWTPKPEDKEQAAQEKGKDKA